MRKIRKYLGIDNLNNQGIKGENITIAVLDSGVVKHPDFGNRLIEFKDFINDKKMYYDDEGHGTHVSGIIAGNGNLSNGLIKGVAPEACIVSLKVLNYKGMGKEDKVIEGIRWIIDNGKKYNIRVVNISFGTLGHKSEANSRLLEAVNLLWDLGYIVVAAAGNNGPGYGSISTPGDSKKIITVGADRDNLKMIVNGKMTMNYSGRGPTYECIQKPDLVAPANNVLSCCNLWQKGYPYIQKSGTSMATPIVTGVICLMLSVNPLLTNNECKKILKQTAIDLKMDGNRQGWGLISPDRTVAKVMKSL